MKTGICTVVWAAALAATAAGAQEATPALTGDGFAARFAILGQVQPRSANSIEANRWSVGGEAIDRDYSTYNSWRTYLGPLGAKAVRLQSGWARTDMGGGRYEFGWLDPIIDDMLAQGVQPWVSLSYGNDRYPGGGAGRRDSPLPSGAGRKAWLAYVTAVASRYRGKVKEYELWNEPELVASINAVEYGTFAHETAQAIKKADPGAGVILGAFAGAVWKGDGTTPRREREFARTAVETFVKLSGKGAANAVTYHAYHPNPDAVYPSIPSFKALIHDIDPAIEVRQGENGAPSLNQQHYALRNMWWTEERQAKWLLRRMLGDAAFRVPTSIFTITEMHYPVSSETNLAFVGHRTGLPPAADSTKHFKGLLETRLYAPGTPEDNRTVVRTKMGYPAMQAVTAIFDSRLQPIGDPGDTAGTTSACTVTGASGPVTAHAFRRADGAAVLAVWRSGDAPGDNAAHEAVDISCPGVSFGAAPVYVDLLTRAVYRTRGVVTIEGNGSRIAALPIYDSPVLIAAADLVSAR